VVIKIIIFFILASSAAPAIALSQETKQILLQDSSADTVRRIDFGPLNADFPTLSLALSGTSPELSPGPLYLSLSLSASYDAMGFQKNLDISTMWQNEILKQEKYKTIRMILGSIEAGGVAYLTYLHLRKYGSKY
jgi:hypothetical protein